mgnify:CR=1 FL=1|jgi:hypothetical protein
MNNTSSSEPITIEETQKILEQMTNCICKVKSKGIYGTGFFCRIRFLDNTFIKVLTTSYQILDEHYFKENNEINLIINNQARIINLNKKRKIYSNKDFDLTLIEIKESDKINDYFELDENILSQENPKLFYENKTIYIIQYLNMEKASVSYGIFNDLIDSEIKHTCSTKPGSNCSPILNSMNNKIIGISKISEKNDNNKGIFLKVPINEFKKQIEAKEEIKEKKVNIIDNKLKDTNLLIEKPKIMIVFKTGKGYSYGFIVNYGITVEQLLQKFIKKVKKIDYANISKSKIKFLFNSVKMNENEKVLKTLVEKYFENRRLPTIIVTHL